MKKDQRCVLKIVGAKVMKDICFRVYVQVFSHWEHGCLHDTKQLFRSLLSCINCALSSVSFTSLILPDRIVQSYLVVSTTKISWFLSSSLSRWEYSTWLARP